MALFYLSTTQTLTTLDGNAYGTQFVLVGTQAGSKNVYAVCSNSLPNSNWTSTAPVYTSNGNPLPTCPTTAGIECGTPIVLPPYVPPTGIPLIPPVPFPANSVDCSGTITQKNVHYTVSTVADPTSVQLVKMCPGAGLDPEVVCLVLNGSPVGTASILGIAVYDTSVVPPTTKYYIGSTDVTATHTQVSCTTDNKDYELRETCLETVTQKFTRIDWFEKTNFTVPVATIYFDTVLGTYSTTAPIGATPCLSTDNWELLEVELVDDVANNGTGAIIPYSELYKVSSTGIRTLIATVDEKGANYTLVGTRRSANEIGSPTQTASNQLLLDGATWSPSPLTTIFSYAVISVSNPLTPPTYKGSNNVIVPLFSGESGEFEVIEGTTSFNNTNILITAQSGDKIKISYSEII